MNTTRPTPAAAIRWGQSVASTGTGPTAIVEIDVLLPGGGEAQPMELGLDDARTLHAMLGDVIGDLDRQAPTVLVPLDALRLLVQVAGHVSVGRSAAFLTRYPDAEARRALGALDDAGLLDQFREPVEPEPRPTVTVPCNWTVLNLPHPGHAWWPQPGMDPVWCTGTATT